MLKDNSQKQVNEKKSKLTSWVLTSFKRNAEEGMSPEGINLDVRLLDQLVFIAMIDPSSVNSDQVLVDPSVLEGADNSPGVELFWLATASINTPAVWDVVKEEWVLKSMRPNMFDSKLWPPDEVHLLDLGVGK